MTAAMTGRQLLDLLAVSVARRGSNDFSQVSGLRYAVRDDRPTDVRVLKDPARPEAGYAPVVPAKSYRVATIDFQANFIEGYKQLFQAAGAKPTPLDVHQVLLETLAQGPIQSATDGRTGSR